MSGLILNFFTRAVPGRALRSAALSSNLTRVANVLNTIQGEGCVIHKPILNEGLGWTIEIGGGSSDMEADQLPNMKPKVRPTPFLIAHYGDLPGLAAHWEVSPGPVSLNGAPVRWDKTQWPAYQDLRDGDEVFLVIYEELKEGEPIGSTVTDPDRIRCGLYSTPDSPVTGSASRCAHLIGRMDLEREGTGPGTGPEAGGGFGAQCFEGALVLSDFHGDDGNSITGDTQEEVFSCVSNGEKALPDPKEPVDPNAPALDLVVRSYHLAEDTFRHNYIGWRTLLRDATEGVKKLIIEKLVQHPELPPADMFIELIREWWEKQTNAGQPSTSTMQETRWPVGTLLVGTPFGDWKPLSQAIADGSSGIASQASVDAVTKRAEEVQGLLDAIVKAMEALQERIAHMKENLEGNDETIKLMDNDLQELQRMVSDTARQLGGAKQNTDTAKRRLLDIFKRIDKLKQP